jgi:hypothetical protein
MKKKYEGKCYDWDEVKNIIKKNKYAKLKNFELKKNVIFFKGTATTKKTFKLREDLEEYARKRKDFLEIKLDGWQHYEPVENFSKYKFLLNLPGHYHWSNRLKYLFLMKSFVINVNTQSIFIQNIKIMLSVHLLIFSSRKNSILTYCTNIIELIL